MSTTSGLSLSGTHHMIASTIADGDTDAITSKTRKSVFRLSGKVPNGLQITTPPWPARTEDRHVVDEVAHFISALDA